MKRHEHPLQTLRGIQVISRGIIHVVPGGELRALSRHVVHHLVQIVKVDMLHRVKVQMVQPGPKIPDCRGGQLLPP